MITILSAVVALLKAVPALRVIIALFVKEWHDFDKRAAEREANERRETKLHELDKVLGQPKSAGADDINELPKSACEVGRQPDVNEGN